MLPISWLNHPWCSRLFFSLILLFCSSPSPSLAAPPRGVTGDLWADKIIGPFDFGTITMNTASNKALFNAFTSVVDPVYNRLYVYDSGNSRVLGVSNLSGLTDGQGADMVLGQPDFIHTTCNGDSNLQNFPAFNLANASCLCGMLQGQGSPTEGGSSGNMAVDGQGNLYVPDYYNNRVVRYDAPTYTGEAASAVWGQTDFTGIWPNQNTGTPSNSSLALFISGISEPNLAAGVAIDSHGNLWVTDEANQRVLRFPNPNAPNPGVPSSTADVVLGQSGFNLSSPSLPANPDDLAHMNQPVAVRVDANDNVYVVDYPASPGPFPYTGRVLVYQRTGLSGVQPTYTNGMPASGAVTQYLIHPFGVEFDPSGDIWVSDQRQIVLFHVSFTPSFAATFSKVLLRDEPSAATTDYCGAVATGDNPPLTFTDGYGITQPSWTSCEIRGSVGVDGAGNVFVASDDLQDVHRFPAPIPTPVLGIAHTSDLRVFNTAQFGMRNSMGVTGLYNPQGVAVAAGQLIVADDTRLEFWNMPSGPSGLVNGQLPDGILGTPDYHYSQINRYGRVHEDQAGHLWVIYKWNINAQIEVYNLPLNVGSTPAFPLISSPLPVLGGGALTWGRMDGMVPDPTGNYVWLTDTPNSRVFRVRNPLTSPLVDIVLGQPNLAGTLCNQGGSASAYSLCNPGSVRLDHHGNLYVGDFSLETSGNWRLLRWNASQLPALPVTCLFNLRADAVYGESGSFTTTYGCQGLYPGCGPYEPSFNSDDSKMVLGASIYTYYPPFPGVFQNPMSGDNPVTHLNDYSSETYGFDFDNKDNLYALDSQRNRVLIYYDPYPLPTPTPTATPSAAPTNSPTLTPTVTSTPNGPEGIYPNPVYGKGPCHLRLNLASGSDVKVQIWTLASRKVAEWNFNSVPPGWNTLTWEAEDKWGTPLANGLYYLVSTDNQKKTIWKLLVLR